MSNEFSRRRFQLWDYNVSHRQVLLRSPGIGNDPNIDLIFTNVRYLQLPTDFDGLEVVAATEEEVEEVSANVGSVVPASDVFVLIDSHGRRGLVAASEKLLAPNHLEMFESSLERLGDPRSRAEEYEQAVLLALSTALPKTRIERPLLSGRDLGVDALIRNEHGVIAVEAKFLRGQDSARAVRRTVMDLVSRVDQLRVQGLLVLVSVDSPQIAESIRSHLLSALGSFSRFEVLAWNPGDPVTEIAAAAGHLTTAA